MVSLLDGSGESMPWISWVNEGDIRIRSSSGRDLEVNVQNLSHYPREILPQKVGSCLFAQFIGGLPTKRVKITIPAEKTSALAPL
jgi:hypothetical protein